MAMKISLNEFIGLDLEDEPPIESDAVKIERLNIELVSKMFELEQAQEKIEKLSHIAREMLKFLPDEPYTIQMHIDGKYVDTYTGTYKQGFVEQLKELEVVDESFAGDYL